MFNLFKRKTIIVRNDQWELEGDCKKCRRESYCGKECSLKKSKSTPKAKNKKDLNEKIKNTQIR